MKRITKSILIFSFLFLFTHCDSIFDNDKSNDVVINRNIAADMLGNNDEITTTEEVAKIDSFFNANEIGYAVGSGYSRFGNSIPADTIKYYFHIYSPLCKDEAELRNSYKGIGIKTPFVGIFVMKSNNGIIITKLYRAPGPNVYGSNWEEIKIL